MPALGKDAAEGVAFVTEKNDAGEWSWSEVKPAFEVDETSPIADQLRAYITESNPRPEFVETLLLAAYRFGQAARKPVRAKREKREGDSKTGNAVDLLRREDGVTAREILDSMGWKAVSIPALAARHGLTLTKVKEGKTTRYFGKEAA